MVNPFEAYIDKKKVEKLPIETFKKHLNMCLALPKKPLNQGIIVKRLMGILRPSNIVQVRLIIIPGGGIHILFWIILY